jgi:hypothetical protein
MEFFFNNYLLKSKYMINRKKELVVKIKELPIRSVILDYSKISEIYGGKKDVEWCLHKGEECRNDCDCCNQNCVNHICSPM